MGRYLSLAWKHSGEVAALTRHAKLCLSSTRTKQAKLTQDVQPVSRRARIVLKTSPGIAECERQKSVPDRRHPGGESRGPLLRKSGSLASEKTQTLHRSPQSVRVHVAPGNAGFVLC